MPKSGNKRYMSRSDAVRRLDPERYPYADLTKGDIKRQQELIESFSESPFNQRPTGARAIVGGMVAKKRRGKP